MSVGRTVVFVSSGILGGILLGSTVDAMRNGFDEIDDLEDELEELRSTNKELMKLCKEA
jgi:hypothetical protein